MTPPNRLAQERADRGLTLAELCVVLRLKPGSRGWLSEIENARKPASARVAHLIERWSEGRVPAGSLCPELADPAEGDVGHGAIPAGDVANMSGSAALGAENPAQNISRTGATA